MAVHAYIVPLVSRLGWHTAGCTCKATVATGADILQTQLIRCREGGVTQFLRQASTLRLRSCCRPSSPPPSWASHATLRRVHTLPARQRSRSCGASCCHGTGSPSRNAAGQCTAGVGTRWPRDTSCNCMGSGEGEGAGQVRSDPTPHSQAGNRSTGQARHRRGYPTHPESLHTMIRPPTGLAFQYPCACLYVTPPLLLDESLLESSSVAEEEEESSALEEESEESVLSQPWCQS